ncbi:AMP-dependent synthetase/ligase [Rhodococcus opacus]|jgi:long-subunit acyl-CoA synthetase (AMP-forming)|uniref:AMP-dependent synthetase/ligase n=1 Tax=Rhodococcus opacus TaxID=37919 RepID=UPI002473209F|nr:AMP-dependent synthetase/ligase [Rhodococcus opacus]MDH6291260.1 long-chain acyl-CoA synthetase [Rhodococcus opacus]
MSMDSAVAEPTRWDRGAPVEASTVPEAFQRAVVAYADKVALRSLGGETELTWSELGVRVRRVASGLRALGLQRGDTLALLLPNSIDAHVIDYAAAHIGVVPFNIFNSSSASQIAFQVSNAGARVIVTERKALAKTRRAIDEVGSGVAHLVVVDGDDTMATLDSVVAAGDPDFDFDAAWREVLPGDLATMIYTSGTTGPPKGAEWSHHTVMSQQRALAAGLPIPTEAIVSFLPLAHAGGRINALYMALVYGATLTACPDIREIPACLVDARPDAFFAPPRFWEKLQVAVEGLIEAVPDEIVRREMKDAVDLSLQWVRSLDAGSDVSSALADELAWEHTRALKMLEPIVARLGLDRIKAAYIGGAPCAPEVVQFFRAIGVPLLEAYGATEVSLNIFNRVDDFKTGTAGKPLPGVEVSLADDGELLCRFDGNMVGYRNEPQKTAETVDNDGWLHTGDIATIDADGYVAIVDRKKEIIINSAGKNMSPALIESTVRGESSLIGQVVAVGDGRRYVTALITLDPEAVPVYAARLGLGDAQLAQLVESAEIRQEVQAAVDRANGRLNSNEQVKRFALLPTAWTPDSDELTPTAKLKRRVIHSKYVDAIDALYAP